MAALLITFLEASQIFYGMMDLVAITSVLHDAVLTLLSVRKTAPPQVRPASICQLPRVVLAYYMSNKIRTKDTTAADPLSKSQNVLSPPRICSPERIVQAIPNLSSLTDWRPFGRKRLPRSCTKRIHLRHLRWIRLPDMSAAVQLMSSSTPGYLSLRISGFKKVRRMYFISAK